MRSPIADEVDSSAAIDHHRERRERVAAHEERRRSWRKAGDMAQSIAAKVMVRREQHAEPASRDESRRAPGVGSKPVPAQHQRDARATESPGEEVERGTAEEERDVQVGALCCRSGS
jgi:hypothetical protein